MSREPHLQSPGECEHDSQPVRQTLKSRRPRTVTVLGVCGIVYGAVSLFNRVSDTLRAIDPSHLFPDSLLGVGELLFLLLSCAVAAGIVVASVGLLKLQAWARTALIWYLMVVIVWKLFVIVVVILGLIPAILWGDRLSPEIGLAIAGALFIAAVYIPQMLLLWGAYYLLTLPHVKSAFVRSS